MFLSKTNMKNGQHLSWRVLFGAIATFTLILGLPTLASAAEVQIFSNEQRTENANTMILNNDDTAGDVVLQFGNTVNDSITWDGTNFNFSAGITTTGNIDVDGTITAGSGNIALTNATGNIDGEVIQNDTIDEDSIDFGTGVGQISAVDLSIDSSGLLNSAATDTLTAIDDVDAAVGDRDHTGQTFITTNDTITKSLNDLDDQVKINNDNLTGMASTTADTFIFDSDDNAVGAIALQFGTAVNGETISWDKTNLEFDFSNNVNITGTLETSGNATIGGTIIAGTGTESITNAAGKLLGGALLADSVNDLAIDFGTGANQVSAADLAIDSSGLINSSATDTLTALDDIDAVIGDRVTEMTTQNNVANTDTAAGAIEKLDVVIGNRTTEITTQNNIANTDTAAGALEKLDVVIGDRATEITTQNNIANTDTAAGALEKLDVAVGDTTYTEDNVVADTDSLAQSINKIDQALNGTKSIQIGMNDLTVATTASNNSADIYTDYDATNKHEYYIMKTQNTTQQDLDLKFKVQIPQDFASFTGSTNDVTLYYKTDNGLVADNKIDLLVEDSAGTAGFTEVTGLQSTSWTSSQNEITAGTYTPGDFIYITVGGYTRYDGVATKSPYIGEIVLNYEATGIGS